MPRTTSPRSVRMSHELCSTERGGYLLGFKAIGSAGGSRTSSENEAIRHD